MSSRSGNLHQVLVPFRVRVPPSLLENNGVSCGGGSGVRCYIVGSCAQLGDWNVERAKPMPLCRSEPDWTEFGRDVHVPLKVGQVSYRFFLARCHNPNDEDSEVTLCISHWESFRCPRSLALMDCLTGKVEPDVAVPEFGVENEGGAPTIGGLDGGGSGGRRSCIERGWLTGQTQVHLHLMPGGLEWIRPSYRRALRGGALLACWSHSLVDDAAGAAPVTGSSSSLTALVGGGGSSSGSRNSNDAAADMPMADLNESLNGEDFSVAGRWPATVCSIGGGAQYRAADERENDEADDWECQTRAQGSHGQLATPECHLVFQVDTFDLESTAFEFELRDPATRQHLGSAHLMPLRSQESRGVKILQVVANTRPGGGGGGGLGGGGGGGIGVGASAIVGTLKLHYLVITSMAPHLRNDVSVSYRRYWVKRKTMDVGHRGAGNSHKKNTSISTVRENTIHSMNLAASHGADFVEFDVQFSKDNVPVVFHDFNVAVTMRLKQRKLKQIEVPVKNFTMESLQSMKLCALAEMTDNEEHLDTEDIDPMELQPFPSLRQCLEQVKPETGFLIELKYPQKVKGSDLEENVEHYCERNRYVNRILKDVIECGGKRRIVLCTFDADCCTMLQLKQNRYPVLFITQGRSEVYPPYEDSRCNSTLASMRHALSLGILGLSANVEEFLRNEHLVARVQRAGLVLFLWGDRLDDAEAKGRFRRLGVDALVYDYIHAEKALGSRTVFEPVADEASAAAISVVGGSSRSSSSSPPLPASSVSVSASSSSSAFVVSPASASSCSTSAPSNGQ